MNEDQVHKLGNTWPSREIRNVLLKFEVSLFQQCKDNE